MEDDVSDYDDFQYLCAIKKKKGRKMGQPFSRYKYKCMVTEHFNPQF